MAGRPMQKGIATAYRGSTLQTRIYVTDSPDKAVYSAIARRLKEAMARAEWRRWPAARTTHRAKLSNRIAKEAITSKAADFCEGYRKASIATKPKGGSLSDVHYHWLQMEASMLRLASRRESNDGAV